MKLFSHLCYHVKNEMHVFIYILCAHFGFLVLSIFHEAQAWRSLVSLWKIVVLWRLETGRTINPGSRKVPQICIKYYVSHKTCETSKKANRCVRTEEKESPWKRVGWSFSCVYFLFMLFSFVNSCSLHSEKIVGLMVLPGLLDFILYPG